MRLPRVYPILDTATLEARGLHPIAAAAALLEGGARILQFRHKGDWTREIYGSARQIAGLCRDHGTAYVINDRADFALLCQAGLHLGQEDLPPGEARKLMGPEAVIGFSTHNVEQFRAAGREPVSYLAIGPVYATGSKRNPDPVIGLGLPVRERGGEAGRLPLVAIGGITRANARAVLDAGADSVAVISDMYPDPCTPETLRNRMEEWLNLVSS